MSLGNLDEKQPIRKLEIPINKFNDVAIPHHLDLLRRHRSNIQRYRRMEKWELARKEQANATRSTKQLRQLLHEMDSLRARVQDDDIAKFDRLTTNSRSGAIAAIDEYLELGPDEPSPERPESPKDEDERGADPLQQLQVQSHAREENAQERQEACLHAWNCLQQDLRQLHNLFVEFDRTIHEQRQRVDSIENNVLEADTEVREGVGRLERASEYRAAAYPIVGALLGTCLGGPVGLIAGLKIGGLTAIGGGLLGLTGATLLKKRRRLAVSRGESDTEPNKKYGDDERAGLARDSLDSQKKIS